MLLQTAHAIGRFETAKRELCMMSDPEGSRAARADLSRNGLNSRDVCVATSCRGIFTLLVCYSSLLNWQAKLFKNTEHGAHCSWRGRGDATTYAEVLAE